MQKGRGGLEGGSQVGKRIAVSICRAPNFRRPAGYWSKGQVADSVDVMEHLPYQRHHTRSRAGHRSIFFLIYVYILY